MIDQRTSRRGLMTFGAIAVASDAVYAMAGSPNGHTPNQDVMRKHEARPGVVIAYEDEWFGAPWLDRRTDRPAAWGR
jgi:hypothetical protein